MCVCVSGGARCVLSVALDAMLVLFFFFFFLARFAYTPAVSVSITRRRWIGVDSNLVEGCALLTDSPVLLLEVVGGWCGL